MEAETNVNADHEGSSHKSFMDFLKKNSAFFVFCFMGLLLITIPYGIMYERSFVARHSDQLKDKNKQIIRPYADNRVFKKIVLDNKVEALLVHDPSAMSSSASASMEVGSAYETDLPGLAHFLEHMLFLGSKKYPKESSFEKFITENGGGTNAFTNDVCTTYFFSINAKAMETALDMFANFFSEPLLTENAVDREVNAVNSEYENDLTSDGWRYQELMRRISSKSHPFHKFSIGNLKTLRDDPKANGKSLHKELRDFFDKYYSAHLLTVVVIGPQDIDSMEKMVKKSFSVVKDKSKDYQKPEHLLNIGKAFNELNTGKLVLYKPIKKTKFISVMFPLDLSMYKSPLSHSAEFIASEIGRNFPGSLSSILKENGLAISCYAFAQEWADDLTMITIKASLTDEGFKDYEKVIEYIFAAVKNVKNAILDKNIYKEEALLSYMNFIYQDKASISSNLIEFALKLKKLPLNYLVVAEEVLMDFQPNEIEEIHSRLNIDNAVIILCSDTFQLPDSNFRFKESKVFHYDKIENFGKFSEIKQNEQISIFKKEDEIVDFLKGKFGSRLGKLRKFIDEEEDLTFHDFDIYTASEMIKDEPTHSLNSTVSNATTSSKNITSASLQKFKENESANLKVRRKSKSAFAKKSGKRRKGKAQKDMELEAPEDSPKEENSERRKTRRRRKVKKESDDDDDSKVQVSNKVSTTKKEEKKESKLNRVLTSFDDIMKIPYLVEDIPYDLKSVVNDIDLRKFNFGSPGVNRFIPEDLSLESNCKKGKREEDEDLEIPFLLLSSGSKQDYLETTYIQRSNFTSLINDLIQEKWDNKGTQQKHYLEKECIMEELSKDKQTEQPTKFTSTEYSEGWIFTDRTSMKPYLYFIVHLQQQELLFNTPKEKLASQFLSLLLRKKLSEKLSDADKVGYNINFGITDNGIQLFAGGWSSEAHKVLKVLIESLKEIQFTQKEYNQIKANLLRDLQSDIQSGALSQTKTFLSKSVKISYYTSKELADQINEIHLSDVYAIKSKLFKDVFVKGYLTGNVRAISAKTKFETVLNSINHYSSSNQPIQSLESSVNKDIVKLSTDEGLVLRNWNNNPVDVNNGIINYYQVGITNSLEKILHSIALKSISKSAYIFLRTKHQLGYIVFASPGSYNTVNGLLVGVQGSAKNPHEMDALIEEFLGEYEKQLDDLDERIIEATKIRMLRAMYAKPFSAFSKLVYFWTAIKSGNYEFEDTGSAVSDLTLLTKKRVISYFKRVFKRDQKKFSVQVFSKVGNEKLPTEVLEASKSFAEKPEVLVASVDEVRKREKYSEF